MLNSLLPGWSFYAIDSSGHLGGLAIGYREGRIKCTNIWGLKQVMGMEVISPDFPSPFQIVNIYGPCQGRELFWTDLLAKSLMNLPLMVVGGDLNFSLGRAEAWGPSAREDPLSDFFFQALLDKKLTDPSPIKLKPTWRNRISGEDRIAKRLDRFLISEGLISKIPLFRQWVEEVGNSDHFPIFLDLSFPPPKPLAPFKFNSSWLQDPSFNNIFKSTWIRPDRNANESKSFLFMENMKRLKIATISWAKERQKKQNEDLIKIREELKVLESMEADGYSTQASKDQILSLEKSQNQILLAKEEDWRLKSRAIWLKSGDENTSFFHNYAKGRKSANTIWSLKDEEGRVVKNFTYLSGLGQRHFQRIFSDSGEATIAEVMRTAQCFPDFFEEGEVDELSIPVSKEEVEAAMKNMGKDKIPGPDGWTIELFLHFFDLIGSDITEVVEESRLKGEIYRPFNSTFIALIPKKDKPETFEDFRPISLCNCIYKIIAKLIAIRLVPILSRNISMEQFGFLEGRQIHEAIGVAQEVIHSVKQKKKKGVVLKIDLSKAYDRINWLYLRMLLTHLGFNYSFISWIMGCISNVSFVVLINGAASPFFKSQRGLRQGCPLSPLLFLLVAEGLSRLIHKARRTDKIKGIEVAINLFITHLLFVDDILIFSNGSYNELKEFKNIFDLFMKSTALTWIPKGIMEKIRRLCYKFLWAGSNENTVLPWVAWDKIARPKEWGGWGIKRLPDFSLSLAAKSGWRLISMENLWTRVIKRKYIDPIPLEDWIRSQDKKSKQSSVIWKATVEAFTVIDQGLAWKVGDGKNVRIGRDPWVGCNESYALSPDLLRHLGSKGFFTLNQVEKVGQSTIWGEAWKNAEDLGLNIRWHNEWASYIEELHRSNVRIKTDQDVLMWAQGKTRLYSPKDGYSFLMEKKGWATPEWWSKNLWQLKCPLKSRIFLWCILKRKIPTWDILQARFFIGPGRCPLCKSDGESINHLFTSCAVSSRIWGELTGLLNLKVQWESVPLEEAWRNWWNNHPDGNLRNLPPIFFWGLWLVRNKCLFQDQVLSTTSVATNCAAIYSSIPPPETKKAQNRDIPLTIKEGSPWAFFDGASQQNKAGDGICIHLNHEHSLRASVGLGQGSNNYAELSALRLLMCWSIQRNISSIQIFGDSMNVVKWVNRNAMCHNQILKTILEDIVSLKSRFLNFSICHIFRDKNTSADQLSKVGLQQALGSWSIEESRQRQIFSTQQPPFAPPS
eukprot:PITA_09579